MGKCVFIGLLVICIACVYCHDDEHALEAILRNQVNDVSDDESDLQDLTCDCDYRNKSIWKSGGCKIVHPAPPGYACYCKYKGGWTCGGSVTNCIDKNNYYCQNPDRSKQSCEQGGGDCGGYQ